jgi:hypothetical protein
VSRKTTALALALLVIVVGLLGLPRLHVPPGRDQGIFATAGLMVNEGRVLYRDVFEVKQPLILFTYALALRVADGVGASDHRIEFVNLLDQLLRLAAMILIYGLGARLFGRTTGLVAAAWFGVASLALYGGFWNVTQAECVAGPLTAAAFLAAVAGRESGRAWLWGVAGLCATAAVFFKATALVPGSVVAWMIVVDMAAGVTPFRVSARRLAAAAGGACLVVAPLALYFAAHGAVDDFVDVQIGFNRFHTWHYPFRDVMCIQAAVFVLPWWCEPRGLIQTAPLVAGAVLAFRGPACLRWLVVWYGLAWITVPLQGKLWLYHYALLLPPASLLTAWVWRFVTARASWRGVRSAGAAALGAVLLFTLGGLGERYGDTIGDDLARFLGRKDAAWYVDRPAFQIEGQQRYRSRELDAAARLLRARACPGDGMMVFGLDQTLNFLTGLLPTTRYLYSYPLEVEVEGYGPERERRRREFLESMQHEPPRFLVVPPGPVDMVTGRSPAQQLEGFADLVAWVGTRYTRRSDAPCGTYQVWELVEDAR